jgi:hypothetical protein
MGTTCIWERVPYLMFAGQRGEIIAVRALPEDAEDRERVCVKESGVGQRLGEPQGHWERERRGQPL